MLKCNNCNYESTRAEFTYLGPAEGIGPRSLRRCPQCGAFIYCDELEEDSKATGSIPWGMGGALGQIRSRRRETEEKEG